MKPRKRRGPAGAETGTGPLKDKTSSLSAHDSTAEKTLFPTPVIGDPALWDQVAPTAKWRACVSCGPVERPALIKRVFKRSAQVHIQAKCPACSCHLGYLLQKRESEPLPASELAKRFQAYRAGAKLKGFKPGYAYHQFRCRHGRPPDPCWTTTEEGAP